MRLQQTVARQYILNQGTCKMVRTFTNHTSFESVVAHYEGIKPVKERSCAESLHGYGTSRDIRPIGDRSRKWERIVKISRNCYALSDGYHRGEDAFNYFSPISHGKMQYYAPIVWRRYMDGSFSVQIRNMTGPDHGCDPSRYSFLERHVPRGLQFVQASSRQYITIGYGNEDKLFLAKGKTVPAGECDHEKNYAPAHKMGLWRKRTDDNAALLFHYVDNKWVHDETTGIKTPQNPRVDKALKAKYRDAIKKFFEWGMTMSPLIPLERDYIMERTDELRKHFHPLAAYETWNPKWSREILANENHPMRLQYWVYFAAQCENSFNNWNKSYAVKEVETKEDVNRVRSRYNSFVNNNAGFMKQ